MRPAKVASRCWRHGAQVVRDDERAISIWKAQAERRVLDDEARIRGRRTVRCDTATLHAMQVVCLRRLLELCGVSQ